MNKENQAIDCNAVEISTKDKFKTTSNNQSPTRIYKQNTNVSSSQIYASNIMPNKSNGISNNRDFPIFDKSMSKKFILRGTTLTYDIIVDGINTSGIIDIIDSKISFGVPFKSTMSNGNSRFLFPFTISSRGQQHTFWAVSDKLRRSSMLILHEQSQSLKSIRPHLKPSEEIVGFGAVLRIKNVLSSNQVQLCVSNLPRLLVVDPILNRYKSFTSIFIKYLIPHVRC